MRSDAGRQGATLPDDLLGQVGVDVVAQLAGPLEVLEWDRVPLRMGAGFGPGEPRVGPLQISGEAGEIQDVIPALMAGDRGHLEDPQDELPGGAGELHPGVRDGGVYLLGNHVRLRPRSVESTSSSP